MEFESTIPVTYRITGKQSIERLEPLLARVHPRLRFISCSDPSPSQAITFVWETYCEKAFKDAHNNAVILNRLHNSSILESKSHFAYLRLLPPYPALLETYVARNRAEVASWMARRFQDGAAGTGTGTGGWWAVKASAANGGRDVHIVHATNHAIVVPHLADEETVIQRYVEQPLLHMGRSKFHFRCYGLLTASPDPLGCCYLHRQAFVLTSSLDYQHTEEGVSSYEEYLSTLRRHVTNLSINKKYAAHPGQLPCLLPAAYPEQWAALCGLWAAVVAAVRPFTAGQRSAQHFDLYGLDVIADAHGAVHLLELNRLPGLESSANNRQAEDEMYDDMMLHLLRIVLRGLLTPEEVGEDEQVLGQWQPLPVPVALRAEERGAGVSVGYDQQSALDLLRWRCFVKKHQKDVLAEHN